MTDGKLVFIESEYGGRYWKVTDVIEQASEDQVYSTGHFEDVEGAIKDGLIDPDAWEERGDMKAALRETYLVEQYEEYLAQQEYYESEAIAEAIAEKEKNDEDQECQSCGLLFSREEALCPDCEYEDWIKGQIAIAEKEWEAEDQKYENWIKEQTARAEKEWEAEEQKYENWIKEQMATVQRERE